MRGKYRSVLGIILGLLVGGILYTALRNILPGALAVGTTVIGLSAGVGSRIGQAFGTPPQLRLIVFGSMAVFVACEYLMYIQNRADLVMANFSRYLVNDPSWLAFSLVFLVTGMVVGIKILVGNDPLADVETYGSRVLDFDGQPQRGTDCEKPVSQDGGRTGKSGRSSE